MIIVILISIWLISYVITGILFAENGIPCTLGNFLLALTPILNTLIAIKLSIKALKGVNIFKNIKDTLNIVFRNKRTNGRI